MALIQCPDYCSEVSDQAPACPKCATDHADGHRGHFENHGLPGATRHGPPTIQSRAELRSRLVRVLLPTAHADGVLAVVAAVYVEFDVRVLAQASVYSALNGAAFRTRAHAFALPLTGLVRGLWNQGESRTSESDPTVPAPGRFESPLHRSGLDLLVVEFDSVEIALEIVEET